MTEPLSPVTRAVLNACNEAVEQLPLTAEPEQFSVAMIAAALRAAAEELQYRLFLPGSDPMIVDAKALFDLANELEGQ
jgi:hypothetical protein